MSLQKSSHTPELKIPAPLKKFQCLSQKLNQEKARLAEWQSAREELHSRAILELIPALKQLRQNKFEQVQLLAAQNKSKFTDGQKNKLNEKIIRIALELRHSAKISAEQDEILKSLLIDCGMPISADLIMDRDRHALHDEAEAEVEDYQDAGDVAAEPEPEPEPEIVNHCYDQEREHIQREIQRQKAKQAKKIQQRAQAKKRANQSMKSIYLKIAAMIHPDREQNEQKKDEKTILFQQINQAYEAKDLLTLLKFQVGLGQEQSQNLATENLKAYNIVLEEQLENIDQDIEEIIHSFEWNEVNMYSTSTSTSTSTYKVKDLYKKYEQDWQSVQQLLEQSNTITEYYKDIHMLKQLMSSRSVWEMH